MLVQFSELRCKEVINVADGARLGYVNDLELEQERGQVLALLVPIPGRLFGLLGSTGDYVIPWPCIRRIGGDIILVDVCLAECRRDRVRKGWLR